MKISNIMNGLVPQSNKVCLVEACALLYFISSNPSGGNEKLATMLQNVIDGEIKTA